MGEPDSSIYSSQRTPDADCCNTSLSLRYLRPSIQLYHDPRPRHQSSQPGTVLHRISVNGSTVKYEATGTVPGHVLNQYSMDENQGYFRVATSSSGFGSSLETNVYVLNENLRIVGRLEGLSPGELFYAARFMGDRGYLVTYHNTDPLYVLDLHNPSSQ